jgi:hypothetical protein
MKGLKLLLCKLPPELPISPVVGGNINGVSSNGCRACRCDEDHSAPNTLLLCCEGTQGCYVAEASRTILWRPVAKIFEHVGSTLMRDPRIPMLDMAARPVNA